MGRRCGVWHPVTTGCGLSASCPSLLLSFPQQRQSSVQCGLNTGLRNRACARGASGNRVSPARPVCASYGGVEGELPAGSWGGSHLVPPDSQMPGSSAWHVLRSITETAGMKERCFPALSPNPFTRNRGKSLRDVAGLSSGSSSSRQLLVTPQVPSLVWGRGSFDQGFGFETQILTPQMPLGPAGQHQDSWRLSVKGTPKTSSQASERGSGGLAAPQAWAALCPEPRGWAPGAWCPGSGLPSSFVAAGVAWSLRPHQDHHHHWVELTDAARCGSRSSSWFSTVCLPSHGAGRRPEHGREDGPGWDSKALGLSCPSGWAGGGLGAPSSPPSQCPTCAPPCLSTFPELKSWDLGSKTLTWFMSLCESVLQRQKAKQSRDTALSSSLYRKPQILRGTQSAGRGFGTWSGLSGRAPWAAQQPPALGGGPAVLAARRDVLPWLEEVCVGGTWPLVLCCCHVWP